jgi:hypothetical protein
MAKIIEVFESHRKCSHDHSSSNCILENENKGKNRLKEKIEDIIKRHFESARVFSNLPKGQELPPQYQELNTDNWEYKEGIKTKSDTLESTTSPGEASKVKTDSMESKISDFAEAMLSWLKDACSTPILDSMGKETKRKENRLWPMGIENKEDEGLEEKENRENKNHESCFIRRLHGDNLMSIFWQNLENAYFKKGLMDWNAGLILYRWKELLNKYWTGNDKIKDLLETCPIWPDSDKYDWGKIIGISPIIEYTNHLKEEIKKIEDKIKSKDNDTEKLEKELKSIKKIYNDISEKKLSEKDIKNINSYNLIVEEEYGRSIGISRAKLDDYKLFSEILERDQKKEVINKEAKKKEKKENKENKENGES